VNKYLLTYCLFVCYSGLTACAMDTGNGDGVGFMTGPLMQPGDNCRRCHGGPGTSYPEAPEWTAAGTIFPGPDSPITDGVPSVQVHLMNPDGGMIETLTTNAAGNFYTSTPLPTGFRVALDYEGESIEMPCAPPSGGCGACHNQPPIGRAPGRIFLPQAPEATQVDPMCNGF